MSAKHMQTTCGSRTLTNRRNALGRFDHVFVDGTVTFEEYALSGSLPLPSPGQTGPRLDTVHRCRDGMPSCVDTLTATELTLLTMCTKSEDAVSRAADAVQQHNEWQFSAELLGCYNNGGNYSRPVSLLRRSSSAGVVVVVVAVVLNLEGLVEGGGVDHFAIADVEADVVDFGVGVAVEDEVAG